MLRSSVSWWLLVVSVGVVSAQESVLQTYRVRQSTVLRDVPAGTQRVRWWIAIPQDDRYQEVTDFAVVAAPGAWSVAREAVHGNRFLYLDVSAPTASSLETVIEFTLRRRSVHVVIDPAKVGPITDSHRTLFAAELATDAPHMAVTAQIRAIADAVCGAETNVATQVSALIEHVARFADHYSKDATKPKCGIGAADDCLAHQGGCCTDLHSLFIALARAREIPARLQMGYRVQAKNAGKEVDPGYRCWAEYFVPGYGWVPTDIVEADAATDPARAQWLAGLTERRLWLNEGRELILNPRQDGPPVNTMIMGYAEIDGVPARVLPQGDTLPQLTRTIRCEDGETVTLKAAR